MSHIKYTACSITRLSLARCDNYLYSIYALLSSSPPEQFIVMARYSGFSLNLLVWWYMMGSQDMNMSSFSISPEVGSNILYYCSNINIPVYISQYCEGEKNDS